MTFIEKLTIPGEHTLTLQGAVGSLEAVLTVPELIDSPFVAFLGHPHSLQGGTMNNKVVTTLARVFKELKIPSLRFNFRGVGNSDGSYDKGIGESADMIMLVDAWQEKQPQMESIFAGFSFGSYVVYRAAAQRPTALLITIAPPVHHYDYTQYPSKPNPWIILQGDADEVVPSTLVMDFAEKEALPVMTFAETGHFFHGKLIELKTRLMQDIASRVHLL